MTFRILNATIALLMMAILCQHAALAENLYATTFDPETFDRDVMINMWGTNNIDLTTDGLVVNGNNFFLFNGISDVQNLEITSVRTQVAYVGSQSSGFGLFANANVGASQGYMAGYNPTLKRLYLGWYHPQYTHFGQFNMDFNANEEELVLQFDVVGTELSIRAWHPGEPMPVEPQLTYTDDANVLAAGMPGIGLVANQSADFAVFRYLRVDDSLITDETVCDFNTDSFCDIADLDELLYFGLSTNNSTFDLDRNGGPIDLNDRDAFLSMVDELLGDTNFDGAVNAADLNTVALNWRSTTATSYTQGDLNGDGSVNATDLNALALNWQSAIPAAAVPEPSGHRIVITLLVLAWMSIAHGRK